VDIEHDDTEKQFMVDLAKQSGVLDQINKKVGSSCLYISDRSGVWETRNVEDTHYESVMTLTLRHVPTLRWHCLQTQCQNTII